MLSPGQLIDGKYRIVKLLGEGGMGLVYVAQHEHLARAVALKVVRTTSSPEILERFKREARALARVNSPYVAEALDADVLSDGTPYLVMELLEGRDLRMDLRQRGPLPIGEAVAYVVQSCRGVAAAHRVGVVHRDLKPHNLFLTRAEQRRRVKVVDFGIAKFLDAQDGSLTSSMLAMGTPLYMSPEHIRDPRSVSTPADVWALGVILYELLAGFSPFADASTGAIVAAITLDDPAYLRRARPDVPDALARIVHAALLKDRTRRMPSAEAFADALKPFALADDDLTIDDSTFREGPAVELPRPLPRHLANEVRREIERHVEEQAGDSTAVEGVRRPPTSDRVPGEDTTKVPSLGLISVRPAGPSRPSGARASMQPKAEPAALQPLATPTRTPRLRVVFGFAAALVLAALGGHFARGTPPVAAPAAHTVSARVETQPQLAVTEITHLPAPSTTNALPVAPDKPLIARETRPHKPGAAGRALPALPAPPAAIAATPSAADGSPLHL